MDPDPYSRIIIDDFDVDIDVDFSLDDLLLLPDGQDFISFDTTPPGEFGGSSSSSSPPLSGHHSPADPHSSPSSSGNCSPSNPEGSGNLSAAAKRKNLDGDDAANSARKARKASDDEEEEKRVARLMRNRESAHLSRQRKKHYVEELEEKVRALNSTINELNSRISFLVAENAALRHQISSGGGAAPPPTAAPPPPPAAAAGGAMYPPHPMHFPWIPFPPGYGMRSNGGHVPLVPIPRLKPQQPAPAPKTKKPPESKKGYGKTKKVASITLLGMLLLMCINMVFNYTGELGFAFSRLHDSVLTVSEGSHPMNGSITVPNHGFHPVSGKRYRSDGSIANTSDPLPALLYVPRNGRHVKINGNLIIHSVLASERALSHELAARVRTHVMQPSRKNEEGYGLTRQGRTTSALAVHKDHTELEKHGNRKSSGKGTYGESSKPAHSDGLLQQWFREGLAGPILSSGMCSEVFQFEVSPIPSDPSGIVPASIVNSTVVNSTHSAQANRRVMYRPIPLPGSLNDTDQFESPSMGNNFQGNKPASSMVVSVLADPREGGDLDGEQMIPSSKSLSRIFVVVLVDRIKYVTYSCVLPFKGYKAHLVN